MQITSRISPCLWFDGRAEDAAKFYTAIFANSRIVATSRYGEAGKEAHGQKPGTVMTVVFELDGQTFTALNGGAVFQFTPAISFQVTCETQSEVDHYWSRLGDGGDEKYQQCGWLQDRFGVSWQVVPRILPDLLMDPARSERAMNAMLNMKKLDIAELQRAAGGR